MSTTKPMHWLVFSIGFTLALCACSTGGTGPVNVRVWIDKNQDGKRTVEEIPLSGVAVQLVDPDTGRGVDEQVTDSNGEAEVVGLQDLLPGYQVELVVPKGYEATTDATIPLADVDYR